MFWTYLMQRTAKKKLGRFRKPTAKNRGGGRQGTRSGVGGLLARGLGCAAAGLPVRHFGDFFNTRFVLFSFIISQTKLPCVLP